MKPLLLYFHGFLSSSRSRKAQSLHRYVQEQQLNVDVLTPDFSNYPKAAYDQVEAIIEKEKAAGRERFVIIGSSLGGYMATIFAQNLNLKAVLINPAIDAPRLARFLLGEHKVNGSDEIITLTEQHVNELEAIELDKLCIQNNLLVMLQTGDKTLDYRFAKRYYRGCEMIIEEGGCHEFDNFERHLPKVFSFLELV